MENNNSILKDILTTKDGESYDMARVLGVLTVLTFLGLSIAALVLKFTFDHQGFGIGAGSTFAGVGACLKLKENNEPNKDPK